MQNFWYNYYMDIKHIILHHSAVSRTDNNNQYEAINNGHIKNGWGSIGYNWLIEPNGDLKEGRPQDKPGAHCYGRNHDSLGICLAGNFSVEYPTEKQELSLSILLNTLTKQYSDAKVGHHRDFRNTQCPGNNLSTNWHKLNPMQYVITEKTEQYILDDTLMIALQIGDPKELEVLFTRGLDKIPKSISSKELSDYLIYPLVRQSRWAEIIKTLRDLTGF